MPTLQDIHMEIKCFIEDNGNRIKIIDAENINWQIKGRKWVVLNNNLEIPFDYNVLYLCDYCNRETIDSNKYLFENYYTPICKFCREEKIKKHEAPEAIHWTEFKGHKIQGPFELEVAQFLDEHKINFQTHGEIKSRPSFINKNGKKRKALLDFYLPEYDLYLEPHSSSPDKDWIKKFDDWSSKINILYLPWSKNKRWKIIIENKLLGYKPTKTKLIQNEPIDLKSMAK